MADVAPFCFPPRFAALADDEADHVVRHAALVGRLAGPRPRGDDLPARLVVGVAVGQRELAAGGAVALRERLGGQG